AVVSGGNIDAGVLAGLLTDIRPRPPRKPRRRRSETPRSPARASAAASPTSSPSPLQAVAPAVEEISL
ncbi:MAG: threonine/serine dehydratase, partial [Stenotrophomonas maltophilia]